MSYASQLPPSGGRTSASQAPAAPKPVPTQEKQLFHAGMQQEARSKDGRTEVDLLRETRRSLAEADILATSTMGTLDGQTEQIHRINADAEKIDANLDQSEYLLRGLKPFGWFRNLFRKEPQEQSVRPQLETGRRTSQGSSSGYPASSTAPPPAPVPVGGGSRGAARLLEEEERRRSLKLGAGGTSVCQATSGANQRPDQQRNAEIDKAYDDIDNLLDGLKEKSKVINRTLDTHNKMLPELSETIARDQERINKQQRDIKKRIG
jgi:hypothetical protein